MPGTILPCCRPWSWFSFTFWIVVWEIGEFHVHHSPFVVHDPECQWTGEYNWVLIFPFIGNLLWGGGGGGDCLCLLLIFKVLVVWPWCWLHLLQYLESLKMMNIRNSGFSPTFWSAYQANGRIGSILYSISLLTDLNVCFCTKVTARFPGTPLDKKGDTSYRLGKLGFSLCRNRMWFLLPHHHHSHKKKNLVCCFYCFKVPYLVFVSTPTVIFYNYITIYKHNKK